MLTTLRTRMAILKQPRKIEVIERELPPLGPTQARVRVSQCGICTSEVDLWLGRAPEKLPKAIGHEVAGVVEQVGEAVSDLQPGDSVAAWVGGGGGFADWVGVEERFCVPVAQGAPYPALAEPLACAVNAVEMVAPRIGDDVVVIGAGFMGNLVQVASTLKGPRSVTVADVRPDALARAKRLGATHTVDTASEALTDVIRRQTDDRGADVTYEVTGVEPGLVLAGQVTRMSGQLCIVGYHQGGTRSIPLGQWNWMALKLVNAHFRDVGTIMEGMRTAIRLINAGMLDLARLVSDTYSLDRIDEAFEVAAARREGFVKAVVELT
jgi:L-iditol 2-dehydrogenase